jgi:hypothetical protein
VSTIDVDVLTVGNFGYRFSSKDKIFIFSRLPWWKKGLIALTYVTFTFPLLYPPIHTRPHTPTNTCAAVLPDGTFANQKYQMGVNFGRSCSERCYFLWPFCLFYGQMVYFMPIWYIFGHFFLFFTVLVCSTEKNLATLICSACKKCWAEWFRRNWSSGTSGAKRRKFCLHENRATEGPI